MNRKYPKLLIFLLILIVPVCFCACKKNSSDQYVEEVDNFCEKLSTYDAKINAIDPKATDSSEQLLQLLDDLDLEFQNFARLTPPEECPAAKEHATNASTCMSSAVNYYREALSAEKVNELALENAKLQYENAFIEVKNVGVALKNAK